MRWFRRKTTPARQPLPVAAVAPDSLADDLRRYLYEIACGPHGPSVWVMNTEWLNECRRLDDSRGRILLHPPPVSGPVYILGIPVEIRDDGGAPHLEPAP